jgi:hypothetical protein
MNEEPIPDDQRSIPRIVLTTLLVMRDVYNFKVGEEINPSEGSKESYKKYTRKGHCDCSIDDYEV